MDLLDGLEVASDGVSPDSMQTIFMSKEKIVHCMCILFKATTFVCQVFTILSGMLYTLVFYYLHINRAFTSERFINS